MKVNKELLGGFRLQKNKSVTEQRINYENNLNVNENNHPLQLLVTTERHEGGEEEFLLLSVFSSRPEANSSSSSSVCLFSCINWE